MGSRDSFEIPLRQTHYDEDLLSAWGRMKWEAVERRRQLDPARFGQPDWSGGTIGNSWHIAISDGMRLACIVVEGRSAGDTYGVPEVTELPLQVVLDRLRNYHKAEGYSSIPAFVHDGRTGHVVNLVNFRDGRFVYNDGWLGDSLLCLHQNIAGVDARDEGEPYWSITEEELGRVLCGVLPSPSKWAETAGDPGGVRTADLLRSPLWQAFDLRHAGGTGGMTDTGSRRIELTIADLEEAVDIVLQVDERDRVKKGTLRLRDSWVLPPGLDLNFEAVYLVREFIVAISPQHDREAVLRVRPPISEIESLNVLSYPEPLRAATTSFMQALLRGPKATLPFAMSTLEVDRSADGRIEVSTTLQ
nr:hypothetical protein KPHV_05460 [Kitasatospora purpeofusca]